MRTWGLEGNICVLRQELLHLIPPGVPAHKTLDLIRPTIKLSLYFLSLSPTHKWMAGDTTRICMPAWSGKWDSSWVGEISTLILGGMLCLDAQPACKPHRKAQIYYLEDTKEKAIPWQPGKLAHESGQETYKYCFGGQVFWGLRACAWDPS